MPRSYHRPAQFDFPAIGERFGVSGRTARRWHKLLGPRITDPAQVALMLARQRTPRPAALAAVYKLLKSEITE
jgi:hypothetical protein